MGANPLWIIVTGPASLLGAALVFAQFKLLLVGLSDLAAARAANPFIKFVRPSLRNMVGWLESIFGPAYKFQPTSTHVVLMALILVVAVSTERILAQLQNQSRPPAVSRPRS